MTRYADSIEVQIRCNSRTNENGNKLYYTKFYVWKDAEIIGSMTVADDEAFVVATCFLRQRVRKMVEFIKATGGTKVDIELARPDYAPGDSEKMAKDWASTVAEMNGEEAA